MRLFFAALLLLPLHAPLWRSGPHLRAAGAIFPALLEESDAIRHSIPLCRDPPAAIAPSLSLSGSRSSLPFVPLSASCYRYATRERQSKSVAHSRLEERKSLLLLVFLFFPCPFPAPQALKNMPPPTRAEVLRVLH